MLGKMLPVCLALGLAAITPTLAQTPSFAFSFNSGKSEKLIALSQADGSNTFVFSAVTTDSQEVIRVQKLNQAGIAIFDKYLDIPTINKVIRTSDGNCVIVGQKNIDKKNVLVLTKLNPEGKALWFKALGPVSPDPDLAPSIYPTLDGGFILLRYQPIAMASTKYFDLWKPFFDAKSWDGMGAVPQLQKFTSRGFPQWTYRYPQFPGGKVNDIVTTDDSGTVLVGEQYLKDRFTHSTFLLKIKKNGQPEWTQNFVKGEHYRGIAIVPVKTGVGGYGMLCHLGENNSLHLMRLDLTGKKLWDKLLVSRGAAHAFLFPDDDGSFLCVGKAYFGDLSLANQKPTRAAIYVAKVAEGGVVAWERVYGPQTGYQEPSAAIANPKSYLLGGSLGTFDGQNYMPQEALLINLPKPEKPQPAPMIAAATPTPRGIGRSRGMDQPATPRLTEAPQQPVAAPETPASTNVSPLPQTTPAPIPPVQPQVAVAPSVVAEPPSPLSAAPSPLDAPAVAPEIQPLARTMPPATPPVAAVPVAATPTPAVSHLPVATPITKPDNAEYLPAMPLPSAKEMSEAVNTMATKNIQEYLKMHCPACVDSKLRKTETGYTIKCNLKQNGAESAIWQELFFDERGNRAETVTYVKDWDSNILESKDYITLIRIKCYFDVILKQKMATTVQIIEIPSGDKMFLVAGNDGVQIAFGPNGRPMNP